MVICSLHRSLSIREKTKSDPETKSFNWRAQVTTSDNLLVTIGYYEKPLQTLKVTTGEHNEVTTNYRDFKWQLKTIETMRDYTSDNYRL